MSAVVWIGFVVGIAIVVATAMSVMRQLLVNRRTRTLFGGVSVAMVRRASLAVCRHVRSYDVRDRILASIAPTAIIVQLAAWLVFFVIGFALILWPFAEQDLLLALRQSGSSVFTLGLAASARPGPTAVIYIAAATGIIVVALKIAYIPGLYGVYSEREAVGARLRTRAGEPLWGPEILARHAELEIVPLLDDIFAEWESHIARTAINTLRYPLLLYLRGESPHVSWLVSNLAVLDAAALKLALGDVSGAVHCRALIHTGEVTMHMLAGACGESGDSRPSSLTRAEFDAGIQRLRTGRYRVPDDVDSVWTAFRETRARYESPAYMLADMTMAVRAPWTGSRPNEADQVIMPGEE